MKKCAFILLSFIMMSASFCVQAEMICDTYIASDSAVMAEYSDWSEVYIQKAINEDFLTKDMQKGYKEYITRQHFCEIVYNMLIKWGMQSISTSEIFDDTNSLPVNALYAMGIVNGKTEKNFYPDDGLTREEAAAILARVAMLMDIKSTVSEFKFDDNDSISDWARESVYKMYSCKVMNGMSEKVFSPKGKYTKEQAIATIVRLYELA